MARNSLLCADVPLRNYSLTIKWIYYIGSNITMFGCFKCQLVLLLCSTVERRATGELVQLLVMVTPQLSADCPCWYTVTSAECPVTWRVIPWHGQSALNCGVTITRSSSRNKTFSLSRHLWLVVIMMCTVILVKGNVVFVCRLNPRYATIDTLSSASFPFSTLLFPQLNHLAFCWTKAQDFWLYKHL